MVLRFEYENNPEEAWYEVTETYSKCSLTELKDKFPAISGIAKDVQRGGLRPTMPEYGLTILFVGYCGSQHSTACADQVLKELHHGHERHLMVPYNIS